MSIIDQLIRKFTSKTVNDAVKAASKKLGTKTETFTFEKLPLSVDELKSLSEAALDTPYKTAALTILALAEYVKDEASGIEMINFLKGPQPLSTYEKQFLKDHTETKKYLPLSYFKGASPDNDYTPSVPYTISVSSNPYSFDQEGYAVIYVTSGGADSARQIKCRAKGDTWYMWEQFLLSDIKKPKSEDPWA